MFVSNGLSSSRSSPTGYTASLDSAPFAYAPVVPHVYEAQAQAQPEYVYRPQQHQAQYFEHHAAGADGYYGQAGVVM
jgi:MinD-like ATPase involved in chromosome partitioning or flagellar assembly